MGYSLQVLCRRVKTTAKGKGKNSGREKVQPEFWAIHKEPARPVFVCSPVPGFSGGVVAHMLQYPIRRPKRHRRRPRPQTQRRAREAKPTDRRKRYKPLCHRPHSRMPAAHSRRRPPRLRSVLRAQRSALTAQCASILPNGARQSRRVAIDGPRGSVAPAPSRSGLGTHAALSDWTSRFAAVVSTRVTIPPDQPGPEGLARVTRSRFGRPLLSRSQSA